MDRWTTYNTETGKVAEGQKPFPSRKQAVESSQRVNAVRRALGLSPCIDVRPCF